MKKFLVWAEYDKDCKEFTGNIMHSGRVSKPVSSKAYSWLTWKRCHMTLTEIKPKKDKS